MSQRARALVVEGNAGDADLTTQALETSKLHMDIHVVGDGAAVLDHLLREPPHENASLPDLIVLGLSLPEITRREVLAEVRKHERLRTIPVVILASSNAERGIVQRYELGANCYVTKPLDLGAFQSIAKSIEGFWLTAVQRP